MSLLWLNNWQVAYESECEGQFTQNMKQTVYEHFYLYLFLQLTSSVILHLGISIICVGGGGGGGVGLVTKAVVFGWYFLYAKIQQLKYLS